MKGKCKIRPGVVLIFCSGMVMILGSELGFTDPLRFIGGFITGVMIGGGIYLVISSLMGK